VDVIDKDVYRQAGLVVAKDHRHEMGAHTVYIVLCDMLAGGWPWSRLRDRLTEYSRLATYRMLLLVPCSSSLSPKVDDIAAWHTILLERTCRSNAAVSICNPELEGQVRTKGSPSCKHIEQTCLPRSAVASGERSADALRYVVC
jgi:hypothetical protein